MERSSLHFAQQASEASFTDPREQERRLREKKIYEATRQRQVQQVCSTIASVFFFHGTCLR